MPPRWRIPDTEPPFVLRIELAHNQVIPGESLATAIIHAMDFTSSKLESGHGFELLSRTGLAWNDGTVDVRARSQLPPLQGVSYANLGTIMRVIWDLSKQYGYKTWRFDIFVEGGMREVLVGTVAFHYDL